MHHKTHDAYGLGINADGFAIDVRPMEGYLFE